MTMDVEWGRVTEQMLNLTLEIIYLLTGEDYILVKTSGLYVISRNHPFGHGKFGMTDSSMMVPPRFSLIFEKNNKQKVLEVTNKIIELLTGEVPIRCQDVTVYFSKEEWEYLEGHKDLYKDVMMENQPPLTSPDGSSNRNPPERCPHPLYSRDSTQEDLTIPHHDQGGGVINIKAEVYEDAEDLYVRGDEPSKENEIPPEISTDGSSNRNTPQICPCPLYSQDFTPEHQNIPQHDQFENDVEDEAYVTACKEEECPVEINADEHNIRRTLKGHLTLSPYWDREDDHITEVSPREDQATLPVHPGLNRSPTSTNSQESSSDKSLSLILDSNLGLLGAGRLSHPSNPEEPVYRKALRGNKLHLCTFCGKRFTTHANVVRHVRTHTGDRPYSCSLCGKSFTQKSILLNHQKVHTGDRPFPCPDCGKCFAKSSDVIRHRRVHTGERPYSCLECGKSFTQKFRLRNHQDFHKEEMNHQHFHKEEVNHQHFQKEEVNHQHFHKEEVNHQHFHKEEAPPRHLECGRSLASKSNQLQ